MFDGHSENVFLNIFYR
jgi:hypothetical protein